MRTNKGITLVALVITIIVLIILAGVSIKLVLGDNGIIQKAQQARTETEIAQIKEKVQIDIAGVLAGSETTEISKIQLKTILDKYFDNVPEDYTLETEITAKDEYGNHKMKVSDLYNGAIVEKKITAQDIANATDKSEYYGAIVKGYELPNGTKTDVNWKIFYADKSNIYLIADNYVERANLPNSTTETGKTIEGANHRPNDGSSSYPRAAHFSNIIEDYSTGSSRITDNKLKSLNKSYFEYLQTNEETSTNENMKAVAYMMDTTAWNSKFKDVNNKAEYVIGGPTVELLFKSYNDKYKTSYEFQVTNAKGYQIRKTSNVRWSYSVTGMSDTKDSLYVIEKKTDAEKYWIASPAMVYPEYLMNVSCEGIVSYDYFGDTSYNGHIINLIGFRPLVCLKSDIQLQKNTDETYTIL